MVITCIFHFSPFEDYALTPPPRNPSSLFSFSHRVCPIYLSAAFFFDLLLHLSFPNSHSATTMTAIEKPHAYVCASGGRSVTNCKFIFPLANTHTDNFLFVVMCRKKTPFSRLLLPAELNSVRNSARETAQSIVITHDRDWPKYAPEYGRTIGNCRATRSRYSHGGRRCS